MQSCIMLAALALGVAAWADVGIRTNGLTGVDLGSGS